MSRHSSAPWVQDRITAEEAEKAAKIADLVVMDVCELPDRSSPDNWPEAMLVTGDELHGIIMKRLTGDT